MKQSALSPEERDQIRMSLQSTEYISSEETASDSDYEEVNNQSKRLIKKALTWRSDFLNKNYEKLDLQAKRRNFGSSGYERIEAHKDSLRLAPPGSPKWAVKN